MVEENVRPVTTLDVSGDNDYLSVSFDFKGIPEEEVQKCPGIFARKNVVIID